MKLNNQIVCFCSSRNTSFLHEEKKKKRKKNKILKQKKTQLFYIYILTVCTYMGHTAHIHTYRCITHTTK